MFFIKVTEQIVNPIIMFAANTKGFKNESKYLGQKNYEVTNAVINIQDRTIFEPVIFIGLVH